MDYYLKRPITLNSDLPYVAIPPGGPAHGDCVRVAGKPFPSCNEDQTG